MRVIGGYHRSRKLHEVPSDDTRETKDRVKESIFNSITPHLYQARVLDLFAGSGSLGIEALSRGAASCTFNDTSPMSIKVIRENLNLLQETSKSIVVSQDALRFLSQTTGVYDIILLDPPYGSQLLGTIVQQIASHQLLDKFGVIVALSGKNDSIDGSDCDIITYKTKKYGLTTVTYLKWGDNV